MISLVRVDDRLIHGQVTVGWAPFLHASQIILVSDRLEKNPVLAAIQKAGGPAEVIVHVVGVEKSVALCRQEVSSAGKVVVLFENLEDVRRALKAGMPLSTLNLGGLRGSGEGVRISDAVFLSREDQEILRDLSVRGIKVETRIMPGDKPHYLSGEERS